MMEVATTMTIEQAVKHLSWRLKPAEGKKIYPNDKDVQAFNLVVQTLNQNYDQSLVQDAMFAKLLIEKLLMLTMDGKRTMRQAIGSVEQILDVSISDWASEFQRQVPMIRLMVALEKKHIKLHKTANRIKDVAAVVKANNLLMDEHAKELNAEFLKPYSIDEFNAFFKLLIFELKAKFQDKP